MIIQRDQAARIRGTAAQILLAAGTIAGDRIQEERVEGVAAGDTPRIIIFADQSAQTQSQAGTALTFLVTLNMTIQCLVEDAELKAAVAKLDTLVAQVKESLLTAPAFTTLTENVSSFRVVSVFKSGGDYILGDARILITGTWKEIYNPVPGPQLSGINMKGTIGPGETIVSQFNPPTVTP